MLKSLLSVARCGLVGGAVAGVVALSGERAWGQCAEGWLETAGVGEIAGVDGSVQVLKELDVDGPGPRGPVIVAGGSFKAAGGVIANGIAIWDPATGVWETLGTGVQGTVWDVVAAPGGGLYVAGFFTSAGGVSTPSKVAKWDGSAWTAIGSVNLSQVLTLAVGLDGSLYAGGPFSIGSGLPTVSRLARWDGVQWNAVGTNTISGTPRAIVVLGDGSVVVGGDSSFRVAGVANAGGLARWNGSVWSSVSGGVVGDVLRLAILPTGEMLVGGDFSSATGSATDLAKWTESGWTRFTPGPNGAVRTLTPRADGSFVIGGDFGQITGVPGSAYAARWDGTAWSGFGIQNVLGPGSVAGILELGDGSVVVGGALVDLNGVSVRNVARQVSGVWQPISSGLPGSFSALDATSDGGFLVGGSFVDSFGVSANRVAKWRGNGWEAIGSGLPFSVIAVREMEGGGILAATFGETYEWDGAAWSPVAWGFNERPKAIAQRGGGSQLVAGTNMNNPSNARGFVGKKESTGWVQLGSGFSSFVEAVAELENGEIVAVGSFATAGGVAASTVAIWDGSAWAPMGSGLSGVGYSVLELEDGSVLVGGSVTLVNGGASSNIARWNGSAWEIFGGSGTGMIVRGLKQLANGDVVAVGTGAADGMKRWDGSAWTGYGIGREALAVDVSANGEIAVVGSFTRAGERVAGGFARWGVVDCEPVCDSLDFNGDGQIEPLDVDAYFSVLGEGPCLPVGASCGDLDFNNDGRIEPLDVDAYFSVLGEGGCL